MIPEPKKKVMELVSDDNNSLTPSNYLYNILINICSNFQKEKSNQVQVITKDVGIFSMTPQKDVCSIPKEDEEGDH
jgi:hypothetical protein